MIRADMSVTEFLTALWGNKVKIALVAAAVMFGPGLYDSWQASRAAEQLETDRKAVDTNASVAGMMLASAWRSARRSASSTTSMAALNSRHGCCRSRRRRCSPRWPSSSARRTGKAACDSTRKSTAGSYCSVLYS